MRDILLVLRELLRRWWLWGVRGLLLLLLLSLLTPPGVRVVLENPPRVVETAQPQLCVHTRLIDEVQEWVIQKSLASVREMGADTIVEFFPWAYIENAPGQYDWRQTDLILRHAQNQGIRVIARMGLVPAWVRPDPKEQPTTFNYLPDNSYDSFGDFVALFAERYAGQIAGIIVWNEPNLAFEWGYRPPDPATYARLLREVYPRIKAANPDMPVLAGALAPTVEPAGSPHALNDILYLAGMYQAGAQPYFDALAVHTYGFTDPADAEPAFDRLNFRRSELLFEVMAQYDDSAKPVYITESGWNDNPRWTKAVRPSQRIAYTLDGYAWAADHWQQVEKLCVWALRYPRPTYSYPDNFTLITTEFQYLPIYTALQAYGRGWQTGEALWRDPPTE